MCWCPSVLGPVLFGYKADAPHRLGLPAFPYTGRHQDGLYQRGEPANPPIIIITLLMLGFIVNLGSRVTLKNQQTVQTLGNPFPTYMRASSWPGGVPVHRVITTAKDSQSILAEHPRPNPAGNSKAGAAKKPGRERERERETGWPGRQEDTVCQEDSNTA